MKKLILYAIAIAFIATNAHSQTTYGLKGGLNLSTCSSTEQEFDANSKIGFHLGAYIELPLASGLSIQPEIIYSTQGAKEEYSESVDQFTYSNKMNHKFDYLNLPILAKFQVGKSFYVAAGPQIGLLLSAKTDWSESLSMDGISETQSGEEDIADLMNSTDFSLVLGTGIELESGLNFSLRYNYGMTDIFKENPGDPVRNSVFQFSAGFKLSH